MADKETQKCQKEKDFHLIRNQRHHYSGHSDSGLQGLTGVSEQGGRCPGLVDRGSHTLHPGTEAEPPRLETHGETQHRNLTRGEPGVCPGGRCRRGQRLRQQRCRQTFPECHCVRVRLCWGWASVPGLSPVAEGSGHSLLPGAGLSCWELRARV